MQNYDVTQEVEYETDDEYRKCLLAVFKLTEFGDIVDKIDALRVVVADPTLLETAARIGAGFEPDLAFFMLFSYDEFKTTHRRLCIHIDAKPN